MSEEHDSSGEIQRYDRSIAQGKRVSDLTSR